MLSDIGTRRCMLGSMQVFGGVEPPLLDLARQLLDRLPPSAKVAEQDSVDARQSVFDLAFVQ